MCENFAVFQGVILTILKKVEKTFGGNQKRNLPLQPLSVGVRFMGQDALYFFKN